MWAGGVILPYNATSGRRDSGGSRGETNGHRVVHGRIPESLSEERNCEMKAAGPIEEGWVGWRSPGVIVSS